MKKLLRALVTAPPLHGAAYVLALAAWAGQREQGDDADLGDVRRADAVATFIDKRFAGEVTKMKIGIVAAETWGRRLAAFFIAFTVWDLTYYLFLRVIDGWPTSLLDRDVFFLIPVTWVGPVATAVVASAVVLVVASWVYVTDGRRRVVRATGSS